MGISSIAAVGDVLLERYRLDAVLGSGGVGVVFGAHDTRLGRDVAIKVLRSAAAQVRTARQRFEREAKALAALEHPNLVRVHDFAALADGTAIMVMERVAGQALSKRLRERAFSVAEVHTILLQTLGALGACHAAGIVHRDLKPGNLLINGTGQNIKVTLIDLGIAHLLSDDGATALTLSGEVFGSPRYMAPEQWLQDEVDGRTDLYAVGLMAYCMLLGRHFILKGNPVDVWQAHMTQERPPLDVSCTGETIPYPLAHAIRTATRAAIQDRPESAKAMRALIEDLTIVSSAAPQLRGILVSDVEHSALRIEVMAEVARTAPFKPPGLRPAVEPADSEAKTVAMAPLSDKLLAEAAAKAPAATAPRVTDTVRDQPSPTAPPAAQSLGVWLPWLIGGLLFGVALAWFMTR